MSFRFMGHLMEHMDERSAGMGWAMFAAGLQTAMAHPEWAQAYLADVFENPAIAQTTKLQAEETVRQFPVERLDA